MSVHVLRPGASTTVQDLGRPGWGASGVPPSGAMDELSFRAANLLAGNDEGAAALEITIAGPELLFSDEHVCALAGAPVEARIDGELVPAGRSFVIPAGTALSIGTTRSGVRCYLAVAGGIDVPVALGSRSTLVAAGFGGLDGRALKTGDVLSIGPASGSPHYQRALASGALPETARETILRVVRGPQEDAFTDEGIDTFYSSAYRVSPWSDRAGVRLEGAPIGIAGAADLDPEGVVTGSVQVPADGMPIVLGPDRPATGGYVKVATVISADLPVLAQARPGDTLRFATIDVEDARAARRERLRVLHEGFEGLG
ncbi:MAG: biotin-dependent carboxyltransferase family protein [Actinomycetota bacterium]